MIEESPSAAIRSLVLAGAFGLPTQHASCSQQGFLPHEVLPEVSRLQHECCSPGSIAQAHTLAHAWLAMASTNNNAAARLNMSQFRRMKPTRTFVKQILIGTDWQFQCKSHAKGSPKCQRYGNR